MQTKISVPLSFPQKLSNQIQKKIVENAENKIQSTLPVSPNEFGNETTLNQTPKQDQKGQSDQPKRNIKQLFSNLVVENHVENEQSPKNGITLKNECLFSNQTTSVTRPPNRIKLTPCERLASLIGLHNN